MTAPQPLARIDEIENQLAELIVLLPRYLDSDDPRLVQWNDEAEQCLQAKGNRAKVHEVKAILAHMIGDIDFAERCLTRAETNGASDIALSATRVAIYLNLGFAGKALEVGRQWFHVGRLNLSQGLPKVIGSGGFKFAAEMLDAAQAAKIDCSPISQYDAILKIATAAKMNVYSDAQYAKVLDLAGEIMRANRLFWLDLEPRISFDAEMDCAGIRYRVDVTPEVASELNSQLTDKIVEADLTVIPLTVRFIGVQVQAAGLAS